MSNYSKSLSATKLGILKACFDRTEGMVGFDEAILLYHLAKEVHSGCIVEIGSYRGRSSVFLGKGSLDGANAPVYAIDPHKSFIGVLGGEFGPKDRTAFYRAMLDNECSEIVSLINSSSECLSPSWSEPISLLWIDGDHSYDGVKRDLDCWLPHLAPNAKIALDDATDPELGPRKLIDELILSKRFEIVMNVGKVVVLQGNVKGDFGKIPVTDVHDRPLLDKGKSFEYIRYNSYRSERYKLFYVAIPKVACTSLKWWFADLEGCSQVLRGIVDSIETDPELVIHDTFHRVAPNVTHLKPETIAEVLASDSYFRFAVVRNPYKRIFSAWQSKLLLREPYQIRPYLNYDFFNQPIECADDVASAFEGFLEHLATNEAPSYWDVHWTPQVSLLRPDLINYSKLVKIENAKELSQALAARFGGHVPDPFADRHTNESLIPYLPEFVTQRSAELIRLLYAKDFETFGYDEQPPATKEPCPTEQLKFAFKAIPLIRGRNQRLGELNKRIVSLNDTMAAQTGEIARQTGEIARQAGEIARQESEILRRDNELVSIHLSGSWIITRPLRQLYRFLQRMKGNP